uniref:Natural cytotoxicity triggering receptor 3 n=1 Tax=Salvator merianae TaxID=96440 RepID=A0A8D0CDB2_SALMN
MSSWLELQNDLLSFFVLVLVLILLVSWAQPLIVSQPSSAEGTEGGTVTLHCSFNSTSMPKAGSYRWVKDSGVEVKNTTQEFMGRVTPISDEDFLSERRANVEIRDLRRYDAGMYCCFISVCCFFLGSFLLENIRI